MLIVHVLLKIHLSLACISLVSDSLKTMKLFFLCLPASVCLPDVEIKKKKIYFFIIMHKSMCENALCVEFVLYC